MFGLINMLKRSTPTVLLVFSTIIFMYLDMAEVIEEAKLQESEIAEQIKFLDMRRVPLYASIILKLLQERLLRQDCLDKGWVLVRFPRDRGDLQAIDSFDTPPNRIIFLATNCCESFKRLRDIRIQKYVGIMGSKAQIDERKRFHEEDNYFIHPTDDEKRVLLENETYSSAYKDMLNYCGEDCAIVNAEGKLEHVVEMIESVIGNYLAF